ncbi:xylulokinase [Microbacterium sp. XT11]|uniref:xylulokinase n=1 Tax=Microbacterium sp. XT11 TaxID=367477 RepID=UPI0007430382|nr:FGGY family carbohydrate kinase [Microbacterium sp. XT11]ALX65766.1 sugar (pentulose and hexulose) kinase [Microbacterium sp. XT11]
MGDLALAYDLGTGGCKASLWHAEARMLAEAVVEYPTLHPAPGRSEQRPEDWWDAIVRATRVLLDRVPEASGRIAGIALSGQSLGVVQVGDRHELVSATTPIWSDDRGDATPLADAADEEDWYRRTGNGFGAELYPVFKVRTLRREDPETWSRTRLLLGSKDWINLRLTGVVATDHSMASGSGAYSLADGGYDDAILAAAEVDRSMLPEPRESHDRIGALLPAAAAELGVPAGVPVFAGAVDNAAMALGSRDTSEGRIYAALGSSSWITVSSATPVIDLQARPYVFRHAIPGMHISALSTFSSGTSLTWLHRLLDPGRPIGEFIDSAAASPPGANGAVFVPTLAGGTPLEGGPAVRGALAGLELGTAQADLVRACLEGIAFSLERSLRLMRELSGSTEELLITGGGSRSAVWNAIYADVLGGPLVRTDVEQQASTLGAAAVVFVGLGVWPDYTAADRAHSHTERITPRDPAAYDLARARFEAAASGLRDLPTR